MRFEIRPLVVLLLATFVFNLTTMAAEPARSVSSLPRLKPRADRSEEERKQWAEQLRELYFAAPTQWPTPNVDEGVTWKEIDLLPKVVHPDENPLTEAKSDLGKYLFYEPRLSGSQQLACASCHDPDLGWADGRTVSFGHSRKPLRRNSPSIRNSALMPSLFWDGRADSLESQARMVLENPDEMRSSEAHVVDMLTRDENYSQMFAAAFGDSQVTLERVAQALACFERTIVGGSSRFDIFLKGRKEILTDAELIGLDLFRREARCMNCHNGPTFSDGQFHNLGISNYGRKFQDLGRFEITGDPAHSGQFRTPSLRGVTQTKPLMHSGFFELSAVLNLYNTGMPTIRPKAGDDAVEHFPIKSTLLKPLGLNKQDLRDLEAFLITLEEPWRRFEPPSFGTPPP